MGTAAPIVTKVKALNKFVREASGVYNYTLVPPPRKKDDPANAEVWDPDTHPLTKPYREAGKLNPSMCSFGHRPSSASRTFHPATMKFRLKKGEIVKPGQNGKTGCGLTPANLAKIISAPKYVSLAESLELGSSKSQPLDDPFGLFSSVEKTDDFDSPDKNKTMRNQPDFGMTGDSYDGLNRQNSAKTDLSKDSIKFRSVSSDSGIKLQSKKFNTRHLEPVSLSINLFFMSHVVPSYH